MRSTGVYPFNPSAIPEYFFCIDASNEGTSSSNALASTTTSSTQTLEATNIPSCSYNSRPGFPAAATAFNTLVNTTSTKESEASPVPTCSHDPTPVDITCALASEASSIPTCTLNPRPPNTTNDKNNSTTREDEITVASYDPLARNSCSGVPETHDSMALKDTPTKILKDIRPIPVIPQYQASCRKQKTTIYTSPEFISKKVEQKRKQKPQKTEKENRKRKGKIVKKMIKKKKQQRSSSSESQEEIQLSASNDEEEEIEENVCAECLEDYTTTTKPVDWIQCINCMKWLHEDCTMYNNLCNKCGRFRMRQQKK